MNVVYKYYIKLLAKVFVSAIFIFLVFNWFEENRYEGRRYQKRAKQVVAKASLDSIYMSQKDYKARNGTYAKELSQLKWTPPYNNSIYTYSISEANENSFIVIATGNIDDDPFIDKWSIDETPILTNIENDIEN